MRVCAVAGVLAGLAGLVAWFLRGGTKLPPDIDAIIDRVSRSDLAHVVSGETGYADSDGVRIWYESIPAAGAEKGAVLLNISMAGNSLFWPPGFIRGLAQAGYRVIRYDQRGTGASDWVAEWHVRSRTPCSRWLQMPSPSCTRHRSRRLGFVAQEIAIGHPDHVASLTLMSTAADPTDASLPGPRLGPMLRAGLAAIPLLRYRLIGGEKNLVKEVVAKTISFTGYEGLNVEETAELVLYDLGYRRGINLRAVLQHRAAVSVTRSRYGLLGDLRAPTLVVHGTADALLPIEHARKLVELIPDARHLWLEDAGHQFPYPNMNAVTRAIISHLDRST